MTWNDTLKKYDRIAITGGPLTGKTTLALSMPINRPLIHTDIFLPLAWKEQPLACVSAVKGLPRFVIEGVQVPRALRKGMEVDVVVWLDTPKRTRNKGQIALAKGVATVYLEWKSKHPNVAEVQLNLTNQL